MKLPADAELIDLKMHKDNRGSVTEILHRSWLKGIDFEQANVSISTGKVLRGVHVHFKQWDCIVVPYGQMFVAMRDFRHGSPTQNQTFHLTLNAAKLQALRIPPGVGHGFFIPGDVIYINFMSEEWNGGVDQFRCLYNDPVLEIVWPAESKNATVSDKDKQSSLLKDIIDKIPTYKNLFLFFVAFASLL